jgi:glycosyltransferase involved in cell wall biosynthesis
VGIILYIDILMDFSVDILIPTYQRKKFEKLISHNISIQTYPLIKNIIIADDSNDNLQLDVNYSVLNYKVERMSIGAKRNFLLSKSTSRYVVFMDTDDFYNCNYISHSIHKLLMSGKSITGTSDMLMYYQEQTYRLSCIFLHAINEATLVIDTHNVQLKFKEQNSSEGLEPLKNHIGDIVQSDINKVMVCLCHQENTISKKVWLEERYKTDFDMVEYDDHLKIISSLNI